VRKRHSLVKLSAAIDMFIADMRSQGRINSDRSETSYRGALTAHAEEVSNRDPRAVNRDDIKRVLSRWKHPNTQRTNRAILVSFYDWMLEEGLRKDNPARQTRRPRRRPVHVYRLTQAEARRMLAAAWGRRERRAIFIGICAGLRSQELLGLQGRHFDRTGWIHVSADIAKGGRERWVPVIAELEPVVDDIRTLDPDDYVLPSQRWRDPGVNRQKADRAKHPASAQSLYYLVKRVGVAAGISAPIHPHLLRHAYGDHVAKFAGVRNAQFLLGHAGIGTTESYLGNPSLDELEAAVRGFGFGLEGERRFSPLLVPPANPVEATTGIEPV
jgi:site-specific recombinase XerD